MALILSGDRILGETEREADMRRVSLAAIKKERTCALMFVSERGTISGVDLSAPSPHCPRNHLSSRKNDTYNHDCLHTWTKLLDHLDRAPFASFEILYMGNPSICTVVTEHRPIDSSSACQSSSFRQDMSRRYSDWVMKNEQGALSQQVTGTSPCYRSPKRTNRCIPSSYPGQVFF